MYPAGPKPGVHFSRTELYQLTVAILALSASFTIVYIRSDPSFFAANPARFLTITFPTSLLAVGTGVGLHEIMHKAVAQRYGFWAEFRYNPRGLLFAIVLAAAIGLIFGAPGATWISGAVTRHQNGRISAAGPVSNVVISALLFGVFVLALPFGLSSFTGAVILSSILQIALINAVLAGFNMVPILPLDGAKVFAWNKAVYALLASAAIGMIVLTLFPQLVVRTQ
jgi:Zn-dependent protease